MRSVKTTFGLIGAVIPVLYCGGLLYYFANVENFTGVPVGDALNPTMIGLGAIGLLFLIPLVIKIVRLTSPPAAPRSGSGGRPAEASPDDASDFDPDAAIARYLAKRTADPQDPASPPASFGNAGPARPGGFGRRGV